MVDNLFRSISITVETPTHDVGNALPVLHEVQHGLRKLVDTGESTVIDLRAIPFGPGDESRLLGMLGEGEIEATLDALGRTHIRETGFHGVWVVDYRDADDQRIGLQLEITDAPSLLKTPADDIGGSAEALAAILADSAHEAE